MIVSRDDTILIGHQYTQNVMRFGKGSSAHAILTSPSRSLLGIAISEDAQASSGSPSP